MKSTIMVIIFIVGLGMCGILSAADTDSIRCGNHLVMIGDTKAEVLLRCGEPLFKDFVGEKSVYDHSLGSREKTTEVVEEWTYDFGSTQFLKILTFRGSRLVRIELGERP